MLSEGDCRALTERAQGPSTEIGGPVAKQYPQGPQPRIALAHPPTKPANSDLEWWEPAARTTVTGHRRKPSARPPANYGGRGPGQEGQNTRPQPGAANHNHRSTRSDEMSPEQKSTPRAKRRGNHTHKNSHLTAQSHTHKHCHRTPSQKRWRTAPHPSRKTTAGAKPERQATPLLAPQSKQKHGHLPPHTPAPRTKRNKGQPADRNPQQANDSPPSHRHASHKRPDPQIPGSLRRQKTADPPPPTTCQPPNSATATTTKNHQEDHY